jgi:hypothetical protein
LNRQKQTAAKGGRRDMRTVFVIGAGANVEIGMPSGDELKLKITKLLDFYWNRDVMTKGDDIIFLAIQEYVKDDDNFPNRKKMEKLLDAAGNISSAMPLSISIDNFIETHRGEIGIAFCGKLAIVRSILEAEKNCALYNYRNNEKKLKQINNSWYTALFKKITEGCSIDKLSERLRYISFIIFNYDRCFEYFMFHALMIYYNIDKQKAKEFIQLMNIIHPYGIAGELWDEYGELTFGETPSHKKLISLVQEIKTFTENTHDNHERNRRVKYITERGDIIVFLGFAYHDQNISLLFDQPHIPDGGKIPLSERIVCYGTGYNISEIDLKQISDSLITANFKIVECNISNITCTQFFKDFWYTLSFKEKSDD